MSEYLNKKELCEFLRISRATVWRWQQQGKIPPPKQISPRTLLWDKAQIEKALGLN